MPGFQSNSAGNRVQVLDRARLLLEILANSPTPLSLHDLAQQASLHPSTAHRIVWNLAASGFVEHSGNGWGLGIRFLDYGHRYQERNAIAMLTHPVLVTLAERTHQDALCAIRDGNHSTVIDLVRSQPESENKPAPIGHRQVLHLCSSGKVFLSRMSADELHNYLSELRHVKAGEAIESLLVEINRIREQGWAKQIDVGSGLVRSVAVGLDVGTQGIAATLVLLVRNGNAVSPSWIEALLDCGAALSSELTQQLHS